MLASTRDESFGAAVDMIGSFRKPGSEDTKAIGAALIAGAIVLSFCLGWLVGRSSNSGTSQVVPDSKPSAVYGRFGHAPTH